MATLRIDDFTDPGCPFAFSAEPARLRLSWLFGDQIQWRPRMVVLSRSGDDYLEKGFTPEVQAGALAELQRRYGMPIDSRVRPRMPATVHACRAVVAARLYEPDHEAELLRRLRIRGMAGDMIDDPGIIALSAREAGIDAMRLLRLWRDDPKVEDELEADARAARAPSRPALALDHKLAPAGDGRRYTCPSYEIKRLDGHTRFDVPGFQPVAVYESAIANLAPELTRRADPGSVEEVLEWAGGRSLATVEVAAICNADVDDVREELSRVARLRPVGPDGWWKPLRAAAHVAA